VGLAGIARLAVRRGIFPERLCREIAEILRELGLPTAVPTQLRRTGLAQEVLAHLHHDKKMQSGQLRVVLPVEKIGRVELGTAADSEFEAVVRELCGEGKA
jgi:3-dehydroquinate synthetase